MRLYFMRHGKAEDSASSDHARQLTRAGIVGIERMAVVLAGRKIPQPRIFASPRVRAQQTATIIAQALNTTVQTEDTVNFEFNRGAAIALLADLEADAHVFFVGHNPSMSEVAGQFIGTHLSMKTGAIVCVELYSQPERGGMLLWYLYPDLLKSL